MQNVKKVKRLEARKRGRKGENHKPLSNTAAKYFAGISDGLVIEIKFALDARIKVNEGNLIRGFSNK